MSQLQGELTFANVAARFSQIDTLAAGPVDLAGVSRIDSAGVAFLLALHRAAAAQGRTLKLRSAAPQLITLLNFYGVDSMFELEARS